MLSRDLDQTEALGPRPIADAVVKRVLTLTLEATPRETRCQGVGRRNWEDVYPTYCRCKMEEDTIIETANVSRLGVKTDPSCPDECNICHDPSDGYCRIAVD